MLRTVPLSIISSFSLYTRPWYVSYRFADSLRAGSGRNYSYVLILSYRFADSLRAGSGRNYSYVLILSANLYYTYHGRVYSEKLLMMDRGTVRSM